MSHSSHRRRDVIRTLWMSGAAAAARPVWADALSSLAHEHAHAARRATEAAADWKPRVLDAHQDETVTALTEAIIPQTDTPGARAALVNRFVDEVLAEAEPADRASFLRGLEDLDARSRERWGKAFASCAAAEQEAVLEELSAAAEAPGDPPGAEFFRAAKSMTIAGYYGTEIGLRRELGDDGTLAFAEFPGCEHPEHGAPKAPAKT